MINENKMQRGASRHPHSPPEGLGLCGSSGVIITDKSEVSMKRTFPNLTGNITKGPALSLWHLTVLVFALISVGLRQADSIHCQKPLSGEKNQDAFLAWLIPIVWLAHDDLCPSPFQNM